MKLYVSKRVYKQIRKLPKIPQIAVEKKIKSLSKEGFKNAKKVKGTKNTYRIRVGEYRLIAKKYGKDIHIILIGHRKNIYKLVAKFLLL